MRRFASPLVLTVLFMLIAGCNDAAERAAETDGDRTIVYATNYPLTYFAQRISGDLAEVRFPQIEGDPAFWEPGDADIADMQGAALILTNGATYEKWAKTVSLPAAKTVDTSAGFSDRLIKIADTGTHSHGTEGDHSHAGTAFTTWMDLDQARQQALAVRDALIESLPDREASLRANADALLDDIAALHADMQAVTATIGTRPLVASHPVYQYFARQYGLNIRSVLWEPESVPGAEAMAALKAILADHPAGYMIWEGEPAAESVELLNAIGIGSIVVDPSGNRPDRGDWLSVMRQNIENLKAVGAASAS